MSNPTGLYSRIKTWGSADTILGTDLNAEFDNVLNNFNPEMLAGYSQNQAQMQIQTSPGTVGNESLATAIAGELERLRFQINAITGNTYWYQAPAASLSQINSLIGAVAFGNKINSGLTTGTTGSAQPVFLLAANTTNSVTLKAGTTAFSYGIAGTTYNIAADVTITGLTLAPSSQNTATVNDLTLPQAGTASNMLLGENGTQITVTSAGTNVTALIGNIAAFKTSASEYLIGRVESATQIQQVSRGYFFNSSNALVSRGTLSNGDTLTLMKLVWIYATTAGALAVGYTNPKAGGLAPSSPAASDYWYDTSVNYWKTYSGVSWVQANATLIGMAITDTANTVATRSFDFFQAYSDLNTCELYADSQNSGTIVRSRLTGGQTSVYGNVINFASDYARWDFSLHMDTGSQVASTLYYFYLDTNGRPWISKVAPFDRRGDLKGYYHPGNPWRCLGYGWSNSGTLVDNVESFYVADTSAPVSNITAASNIVTPYNIIQREQVITLSGSGGAFTQVLPPPAQLKGKYITYVRTDNTLANLVTLQSWGTAIANPVGTIGGTNSIINGMSGASGIATGQLVTGPGILPNTTVNSVSGVTACTLSTNTFVSTTSGTFSFANAAGFTGTVGQQTAYANWGISGAFTTTLATQGESVTITSDGYAYFIISRAIPGGWYNSGPITIGATTTPGTKGTTSADLSWWRRDGTDAIFRYEYKQTGAGTAGSGDYLFTLPTGLTMNTSLMTLYTTSPGTIGGITNYLGTGKAVSTTLNHVGVVAFSSTQVRLVGSDTSTANFVNSGFYALTGATVGYLFEFRAPIVGWAGR